MADLTVEQRFWSKVRKSRGCWEWVGAIGSHGYGNFVAFGKTVKAHRFSYEILVGEIPEGLLACHTCDNRRCVNPAHIFIGTKQDNADDMNRKGRGRKAKGRDHHMTTIDERIGKKISDEYVRGKTRQMDLSDKYGVSQGVISKIVRGVHWTIGGGPSP